MTVNEIIQELKQWPPDIEVQVLSENGVYSTADNVDWDVPNVIVISAKG